MEKRTILAIALSLAVLLGFQYFFPAAPQKPIAEKQQVTANATGKSVSANVNEVVPACNALLWGAFRIASAGIRSVIKLTIAARRSQFPVHTVFSRKEDPSHLSH